jgi:hypothetical protein
MDAATKTRALFKSNFKAADRDMRSEATTGTGGYHGTPTYVEANSAVARATDLLARLAASEQALARALSHASIAPTVDTATNLSTITPDPPCAYCWTHGFCKNINHTSTSCLYPGEGHQIDVAVSNMMGSTATNVVPNPCSHRS